MARRRTALKAALALVATLLITGGLTTDADAAGVWGAGQTPYLQGEICTDATTSSPLAAWDFGTGSPAFLLTPVTSTGTTDSARLPSAANGGQSLAPVVPGSDGFTSASDIAAYAYLISKYGVDSQQHAAEVAEAVMDEAGSVNAPDCEGPGDLASLLIAAQNYAGPYTVAFIPAPTTVIMGAPTTVTARVTSARGLPVPGLAVTFTAPAAGLTSAGQVTDATGTARVSIDVPIGTPAASVTLQANVDQPIGLTQISSSGASVSAVMAAAPIPVTASVDLTIDQTATPAVRTSASSRVIAVGQSFQGFATVSGLRGHAASVAFSLYGPLPLDANGACGAASAFTSSTPVAASTGAVSITGDQTASAAAWAPSQAGCYAVGATASTTNATPNTTATGVPTSTVAVLPTTTTLTLAHNVVGPGPLTVQLSTQHTFGRPVRSTVTAIGPVTPAGGSCAGVDFAHAASAVTFAPAQTTGDAALTATSSAATKPGCYQLQASTSVDEGDLGQLMVSTPAASVLLIAPTLATTVDAVWTNSPAPVRAHVDVSGTYGQPAHVSVELAYAQADPFGCRAVDWTRAVVVGSGPAVATRGDASLLAAQSGPTSELGCYLPVAKLVVDANPAIVVTAPLADLANAVNAGIDPNALDRLTSRSRGVSGSLPVWTVAVFALALVLTALGFTLVMSLRDRAAGRPARGRHGRRPINDVG